MQTVEGYLNKIIFHNKENNYYILSIFLMISTILLMEIILVLSVHLTTSNSLKMIYIHLKEKLYNIENMEHNYLQSL